MAGTRTRRWLSLVPIAALVALQAVSIGIFHHPHRLYSHRLEDCAQGLICGGGR
ncbi:MAG: hypothetical protein K6A64_02080 [Bacteroidales bacterium]|nr:hypothetical protein [Bacteroidales bacterium]